MTALKKYRSPIVGLFFAIGLFLFRYTFLNEIEVAQQGNSYGRVDKGRIEWLQRECNKVTTYALLIFVFCGGWVVKIAMKEEEEKNKTANRSKEEAKDEPYRYDDFIPLEDAN